MTAKLSHALRSPTSATAGWRSLGNRAKLWRGVHAAWSVAQLAALARVWSCGIRRQRDGRLWGGVAFLLVEGAALVIGRGNCPMGERQADWGDPVPFFELVLPPRAAKAAVPALALVTVAGILLLIVRSPGLIGHADAARPERGRR